MKANAIYITSLARTFPALRSMTPSAESWDVDRFMSRLGVLSPGERLAALFVANVWNPRYAEGQGWRFDVIEALQLWDIGQRRAFCEWALDPFFP